MSDNDGNYKGHLTLSLKEGYGLQIFSCINISENFFSSLIHYDTLGNSRKIEHNYSWTLQKNRRKKSLLKR